MIHKTLLLIASFIFVALLPCSSYRILGVFPTNLKSHNIMFEALMIGLAKRGHQVDVITHFSIKNPPNNYRTIINLDGTLEGNLTNNMSVAHATMLGRVTDGQQAVSELYGNRVCELLGLKVMQDFIKKISKNAYYDVIITEVFLANCYFGFGYILKVPLVILSSAMEYPWISHFMGNCDNLAVVPTASDVSGSMTFLERLQNVLGHYKKVYDFYKIIGEKQTAAMRKYFQANIPDIRQIEKNISLLLVNSHPLLNNNKPILPNVIQVAGLHVEEDDSKIPIEIRRWMDESVDGFIYFSMGSMVKIETFPQRTMKDMYKTFLKIKPVRVLLKIVDIEELPPGLPSNVKTVIWIAQVPVLSHKHIRAFITHGGLMGCQEALYFGVPIIGIPFFADQPRNIQNLVDKNMAIMLKVDEIDETIFTNAVRAILYDQKYREYAKHYAHIFRDRPMSAMDTAVFWIEYVIRNGPDVLQSPALDMFWWQIALLDVYLFILFSIIIATAVVILLLKGIYRFILSTNNTISLVHTKEE